jgi:hypothetical protein
VVHRELRDAPATVDDVLHLELGREVLRRDPSDQIVLHLVDSDERALGG